MQLQKRVAARPLHVLLDRLDNVIDRGGGQYSAVCPGHEDRSPSLSIRETDDRVLLHCFAGCSPSEVTAALGLSLADLFDKPLEDKRPLPNGNASTPEASSSCFTTKQRK